jgi:hypothetical protein
MNKPSLVETIFLAAAAATILSAGQIPITPAFFEQPLLLTSAGQNAELQIAGVLAKRAGLTYTISKLALPQNLQGAKTLVLVLGASMKGLGSAGLDLVKEKDRVASLLLACRKGKIPVLCLHLGGESRRGEQTDELVADFLPSAATAVVVKSGNADKLFSKICAEKNIPLIEIEKAADCLEPLKKLFKS